VDGARGDVGRRSLRAGRRRREGARGWDEDPAVWSRLYDAGVDLLNADDLGGLYAVLLKKRAD
jgi:hypothetical protein